MYNTNYSNNMQYNNPYSNYGYNGYNYQTPIAQPMQKVAPNQNFPFSLVRFGTLDEIKGQLVSPSSAIMFIKNDLTEMYIKSCDAMGNSVIETFKCSRLDNNTNQPISPVLDTKEFVKTGDLVDVVRKDDLKGLITADYCKNFITKDDLKDITAELDKIQKQIKMSELWKECGKHDK